MTEYTCPGCGLVAAMSDTEWIAHRLSGHETGPDVSPSPAEEAHAASRQRWHATYSIAESPGFAVIRDIPGPEESARAYAEAQVGTDLVAWGYGFKLLKLRGINPAEERGTNR